jgi:EAL domain-containing protein (putative c-di-GMP-specific phosphodiesterase class I)
MQNDEMVEQGFRVLVVLGRPEAGHIDISALMGAGFIVDMAGGVDHSLEMIKESRYDAVLVGILLAGSTMLGFLAETARLAPDVSVVVTAGEGAFDVGEQAIELGAYCCLVDEPSQDHVVEVIRKACLAHRIAKWKRDARWAVGPSELKGAFRVAIGRSWVDWQPVVSPHEGRIYGFEAFLRTNCTALPGPLAMVMAAERLGKVHTLGRAVRAHVARQIPRASPTAAFFVNVHPLELFDDELLDAGAPLTAFANRVVLEISERALLPGLAETRERVGLLRSQGYRIALDNVGTGTDGPEGFITLDPDVVKLDPALVRGVDHSPGRRRLVRAIVSVCDELGMATVAQAVETPAEAEVCVALGCDLLQGHALGRPSAAPSMLRSLHVPMHAQA